MGETTAIGQLEALSDASKAVDMAAYHKVSRRYLIRLVDEGICTEGRFKIHLKRSTCSYYKFSSRKRTILVSI